MNTMNINQSCVPTLLHSISKMANAHITYREVDSGGRIIFTEDEIRKALREEFEEHKQPHEVMLTLSEYLEWFRPYGSRWTNCFLKHYNESLATVCAFGYSREIQNVIVGNMERKGFSRAGLEEVFFPHVFYFEDKLVIKLRRTINAFQQGVDRLFISLLMFRVMTHERRHVEQNETCTVNEFWNSTKLRYVYPEIDAEFWTLYQMQQKTEMLKNGHTLPIFMLKVNEQENLIEETSGRYTKKFLSDYVLRKNEGVELSYSSFCHNNSANLRDQQNRQYWNDETKYDEYWAQP